MWKLKKIGIIFLCVIIVVGIFFTIRAITGKVDLSAYESGKFTVLLKGQLCIAAAQTEKYIYTGGKEALYRIEKDSFKAERIPIKTPINYIRSLYVINDEYLLIGHSWGLLIIKDGVETNLTTKNGLPDDRVSFIGLARDGSYLIGTWSGAARYSPEKGIYNAVRDGLINPMVNCIYEDDHGGTWYGSYDSRTGGISIRRADGTWYYFNSDSKLPNININQILPLASGEVLAATGYLDRGGAAFLSYENGKWEVARTWTKGDGLAGEKARSLLARADGEIWIGSEYDGLAVFYQDGKHIIMNKKDGLPHNEVMDMLEDDKGNIWLGTYAGLAVYTGNSALTRK